MEENLDIQFPKELIESIGALNDALAQQQDSAAAMLYRLMFRHERNINILDRYADQVLDGVCGMGSSFAEEDYMNYEGMPLYLNDMEYTVPEGQLFVMGDNRNDSKDSRHPDIGLVDERRILGKVLFRITPLSRFGTVN